jgi:hypothetical protein
MKVYAQFYKNSSGYIEGTIPPQFSEDHVKPIEAIGSDGVFILDGRNSLSTWVYDAKQRLEKMKQLGKNFIGFTIVKAEKFTDNGREIYSTIK